MTEDVLVRRVLYGVGLISAVVIGFLFWLIYFQPVSETGAGEWTRWLPHFNAGCNALSATFVTAGILLIKQGRKREHGIFMMLATLASALFLAGYLVYHGTHGDTKFLGQGAIRIVYFLILISHIILSIVVVPMILATLSFAVLKKFDWHKRFARFTYPVWLYVSVTGIVVFLFLRFLNPVTMFSG